MRRHSPRDCRHGTARVHAPNDRTRLSSRLRRWFMANALIGGLFALAWMILRSGVKPSRLAYPCQQAALTAAALALGAPVVAAIFALRRGVAGTLPSRRACLGSACGLMVMFALVAWALSTPAAGDGPGAGPGPRAGYRASVYHVTDCPQEPEPVTGRFFGLDNLITLMGAGGLKFYQSTGALDMETGPDGIIAADDVVIIKINYQWAERGGTNVDLLRGLVRRIVDHPDGFSGEIVICENAQFNAIDFDRAANNAQDTSRSPHDVVVEFDAQGHTISHYNWTAIRAIAVGEYSTDDMTDGYIVYGFDGTLGGRMSYPKFKTDKGTLISLKHGIWDTGTRTYSHERLRFINLPVLKSHSASYGATACVKHYMGSVTGTLSTNSHSAIANGLLGEFLKETQMADLNILDCIWINADPNDGPWTSYAAATRRDELVGGTDPIAIDIWAVKNILIPAFEANGHSPPWPTPSADPDDPASAFRHYLDNSMNRLLAVGIDVTHDFANIDAFTWDGLPFDTGDINGDAAADGLDIQPFTDALTGTSVTPLQVLRSDINGDKTLDAADVALFTAALTGG